jgi:hypothetical protein
MTTPCARVALFGAAFALAVGTLATPARAALDLAVGARKIVKGEALSSCNEKAKTALNAVLEDAQEVGGDTGEWRASAAPDSSGSSPAAAAVHCYPVDTGYVVTFTCAVQAPPYQDSANGLCTKLSTAFDAQTTAQRR